MSRDRHPSALCRRLCGAVQDGGDGAGGPEANRVGDEPARIAVAPGEDATGGLAIREGELCVSGVYGAEAAEHPAESSLVVCAALAVAQGDAKNPGPGAG